ncbi:multiubiquitin domain-containing protein [Paraburkholderia graminis]|uniref:multiubiquitin domain-containing protein n=1 Tax=Paraburkholderia graminis TaxID=60548 RepID=UPI0038BC7054
MNTANHVAASISDRPPIQIEIAGADLVFRSVDMDDLTPTGAQIAQAAGFHRTDVVSVLLLLSTGELEDVRPTEVVDLSRRVGHFIVVESDASYRCMIDGVRIDWPARQISGEIIRRLGSIPSEKSIFLERPEQEDELIKDRTIIDLGREGVEVFYSRKEYWALNVQGVRLELDVPTIVVREALVLAGFNADQGWHIFLKIVGEPKRSVDLGTVIDLRTPGIEKLRLTPRDVNNGEASKLSTRDFGLLDTDERYLDQHHPEWETLIEGGRRWLLINNYVLPDGYSASSVRLALEIPSLYPGAQIDMFYVSPVVRPLSGLEPPNTQVRESIQALEYQRWSRHRGAGSQWRPDADNVVTHLALVESCLLKEVQQ